MSEFAVEAISDGLRVELYEFGIGVTVVEPGVVLTPMMDKIHVQAPTNTHIEPVSVCQLCGKEWWVYGFSMCGCRV